MSESKHTAVLEDIRYNIELIQVMLEAMQVSIEMTIQTLESVTWSAEYRDVSTIMMPIRA